MQALFVDAGRYGNRHLGFTQSGAMDEVSLRLANILVGNPSTQAAIEILLGDFEVSFTQPLLICVTGARTNVLVNHQEIAMNAPHLLEAGDSLMIKRPVLGARNYLSFSAKVCFSSHAQSYSACITEQSGGHGSLHNKMHNKMHNEKHSDTHRVDDVCLKSAQSIQLKCDLQRKEMLAHLRRFEALNYKGDVSICALSLSNKPDISHTVPLDYIPSYQHEMFSNENILSFENQSYTVSNESSRMGMRLQGRALDMSRHDASMLSEGIAFGAVQITADGQPIVLLKERQTIGGYPKIATLTFNATSLLAQCLPGTAINFVKSDLYSARIQKFQVFRHIERLCHLLELPKS